MKKQQHLDERREKHRVDVALLSERRRSEASRFVCVAPSRAGRVALASCEGGTSGDSIAQRERERSNSSDCETCPRGCRGCTLRLEPAHSLRFTGRRRRLQRKPRGVASSQEEPAAAERKREEENEKEIVHLKARDAQTTTVARRSSKQRG